MPSSPVPHALKRPTGTELRLSVAQRQKRLAQFGDQFEEFVEILCDAAQYGPTPFLEIKYDRLQSTMRKEYAELRPFLGAFLPPRESDTFGLGDAQIKDTYEELFMAPSLREFLANDDGETIHRIMDGRVALSKYEEHLRQLAARVA